MNTLKYFQNSIIVSIIGLIAAFFIGGFEAVYIALILSILEVSLSFDNAIVNASVLENMEEKWKNWFITWGMIIAVFGVRLLLPVFLVSIFGNIDIITGLTLAIDDPSKYQEILEHSHISLMGFGSSFLMLVGLDFFINHEKDNHWVRLIENPLSKLGKVDMIQVAITIATVLGINSLIINPEESNQYLISSAYGVVVYILMNLVELILNNSESKYLNTDNVATNLVKGGIASVIYLEVLDASFSMDGLFSAFLFTNNIFIIMIGLGLIGSMFVRSMTIMLVDKGTLAEFKYLEHSAYYSILSIAIMMAINVIHEIPEIVSGGIATSILIIGLISSIMNKE